MTNIGYWSLLVIRHSSFVILHWVLSPNSCCLHRKLHKEYPENARSGRETPYSRIKTDGTRPAKSTSVTMNTLIKSYRDIGAEPVVNLFVCSLVDSEWQAINIVDRFRIAGFSSAEVSVLIASRTPAEPMQLDADGVVISVLDSRFDWLGGLTPFHLPAVGLFRGAGPILTTFTGWNRFDLEDIANPLQTFGIFRNRAEYYAERLAAGEILLAVHSSELRWAKRAVQAFHRMGAKDVHYSGSLAVSPLPEEQSAAKRELQFPRLTAPEPLTAVPLGQTPTRFVANARPEAVSR